MDVRWSFGMVIQTEDRYLASQMSEGISRMNIEKK